MSAGRALSRALRAASAASRPSTSRAWTSAECGGPALAASAGSLAESFATARPFAASAAAARHVDASNLASGPRGSSSLPRGALPGVGVGLGASPFARRSTGVLLGAELASQTRHASGGRGWFGLGGGAANPTDTPDASTATTSSAVADVADVACDLLLLGATLADPSALGEVAAIAGDDSWWTTSALMYVIEYFHLTHGMEWWHAIVATTLIMRVLTIPLTVVQQRNAARLHLAKPEIEAINKLAKENSHDQAAMEQYQAEIWKIWAKYDCNPAKMFRTPLRAGARLHLFLLRHPKHVRRCPLVQDGGRLVVPRLVRGRPDLHPPAPLLRDVPRVRGDKPAQWRAEKRG